jgi:hypothetical protein
VKHDHIVDALSIGVLHPRLNWRGKAGILAIDFGGKFAAGLVMGIGFAIGPGACTAALTLPLYRNPLAG